MVVPPIKEGVGRGSAVSRLQGDVQMGSAPSFRTASQLPAWSDKALKRKGTRQQIAGHKKGPHWTRVRESSFSDCRRKNWKKAEVPQTDQRTSESMHMLNSERF